MKSIISHLAAVILFSGFGYVSPASLAGVFEGPVHNPANGHRYYLLEADTWWDSETAAKGLGGNLVTINDQVENDWVVDTFGLGRNLWIGFYQIPGSSEPGGGWRWTSGETSTYTNWDVIEPNDSFGNEDYVQIWGNADDIAAGPSVRHLGKWNDFAGDGVGNPSGHGFVHKPFGVVEVVPEASSLVGLLAGLVGLAYLARGSRKRAARRQVD